MKLLICFVFYYIKILYFLKIIVINFAFVKTLILYIYCYYLIHDPYHVIFISYE